MKKIEKELKNKRGITLIALVVTIIILLILAAITITLLFNNNSFFGKANEAEFKYQMAAYKEKVDMYTTGKIMQTMNNDTKWINSGEVLKEAITDKIIEDITQDDVSIDIRDILPEIKNNEEEYIVVYKGEMHYVSSNNIPNNEEKTQWCIEIGIPILSYAPSTGIEVKNGDYELVKGIYLCTPNLVDGFVKEKTRYLEVTENGSIVPGNWITHKPNQNWYDYANRQWANIHVENNGQEIYYVWIPRYCFKLDTQDQRSEVQFIDIDNSYKDENGNITTWEQRIAEDPSWQIPEAFTFNGQELAGFWATKYTIGDITTPSTIDYDMVVYKGVVTIKNISLNTTITDSNPIAKYTVALNGKIVQTITDSTKIANISSEIIEFSNLRKGNNTINLTALNENGEIVGSMTKEYATAVVNPPVLKGFNPQTTFFVTYDAEGKEHSTIPITQTPPSDWYDYGSSEWANIVTRNNNGEVYYVWIPRYQFILDQTNQRSTVKFIAGTSTQVEEGYQIPEAFTFNGTELTGFWATKYTIGDITESSFNTEVVAKSNTITTRGITGTGVVDGLTYNYYIDGTLKGTKTNATDNFTFTGLKLGTEYNILIEIRNTQTDEYVAAITKVVTTQQQNEPDLTGFNPDVTYYVYYDDNGNETIGENIKADGSNARSDWYDYGSSKWANILVRTKNDTGTVVSETYFTWIPRYQFTLDQANQRSNVKFISGTGTDVDAGYQIPEAFTFNGQELTGFWAMKYTVGE